MRNLARSLRSHLRAVSVAMAAALALAALAVCLLALAAFSPPASAAAASAGKLYAFGYNGYGQLGIPTNSGYPGFRGTVKPNPTPALVSLPGASGPVTQIAQVADGGRYNVENTGILRCFAVMIHLYSGR